MILGLGTAALGRPQYINIRSKKIDNSNLAEFKKQSFAVLETAYLAGVRYFDTAPGYGLAEKLMLEWLQTKRDKTIEVATKWGYTYTANFNPAAVVHEVKEHSLSKLKEQWQFSKQLLPYLKVYQIHSATLETGVLENSAVLEELAFLKKNFNLKIGLTTTGANQVEVIKKALYITVNEAPIFDVFQVTYNIFEQSLLEISAELKRLDKKIIIKEALANGRVFRNEKYPKYTKAYEVLEQLANKHKVGVDAIALKYATQSTSSSTVLSGASDTQQINENLKLNSISLSTDDIQALKSLKVTPKQYWDERKLLGWN